MRKKFSVATANARVEIIFDFALRGVRWASSSGKRMRSSCQSKSIDQGASSRKLATAAILFATLRVRQKKRAIYVPPFAKCMSGCQYVEEGECG